MVVLCRIAAIDDPLALEPCRQDERTRPRYAKRAVTVSSAEGEEKELAAAAAEEEEEGRGDRRGRRRIVGRSRAHGLQTRWPNKEMGQVVHVTLLCLFRPNLILLVIT